MHWYSVNKSFKALIVLSALGFFKNGILFLPSDKWSRYYASTLELFTALVETAHLLKRTDDVTDYSKEVVANAQKYEDKMRCEC